MSGAQARRSAVEILTPASVLVVDFDSDLHQLLKNAIERFKLRLTLCETSARDFRPGVVASSPDVVLVNLAAVRICLELLPKNSTAVAECQSDLCFRVGRYASLCGSHSAWRL